MLKSLCSKFRSANTSFYEKLKIADKWCLDLQKRKYGNEEKHAINVAAITYLYYYKENRRYDSWVSHPNFRHVALPANTQNTSTLSLTYS